MRHFEAIKEGFRLVNKNWQLVLIQLGLMLASSIGFFIVVGIPLAIAFIIFGIDLTELADARDIFKILKGPSELLSRYLPLILIVLASLLMYLILVALLGMYVFGGAIGIIGSSIKDKSSKFRMHTFFGEAKRLFLRLIGFTSVIGSILIVTAFFLGLLKGSIAALVSFAQAQDSTLALFFETFLSLILITIGAVLILGLLSISLFGIAALFFKDAGPLSSVKEGTRYLIRHPKAFWLYVILFVGYLFASFLIILLSYPFTFLPIIGTIISFPFQLISYAFETYLGLMIIATILNYYYSTEIHIEPTGIVSGSSFCESSGTGENKEGPDESDAGQEQRQGDQGNIVV